MILTRLILVLVLDTFLAGVSFPQQPSGEPFPPAIPSYPDSEKGLRHLLEDILGAAKNGEAERLQLLTDSMVLPHPEEWFEENFGSKRGALLAKAYEELRPGVPRSVIQAFHQAVQNELFQISVTRFQRPCEEKASAEQYPILAARETSVALYDVWLTKNSRGLHLWFLAYVEGGFRYLGATKFLPADGPPSGVEVPLNKQQAKLLHHVVPAYPQRAKRAGLQGTVKIHAIIGTDGRPHDLLLLEGHCWLAQPALEAVRQWRYSPTLIDGKPVEVITTIQVVFELR